MPQIPMTREYAEAVGNECENVQNRSLILDKFFFPKKWFDGAEDKKASFLSLKHVAANTDGYGLEELRAAHTRRFLELLRDNHDDARLRVVYAKLEGRLAINLAEGLIQNAGMSLDRIFGLPLIPGSAVKGVTRAAAQAELPGKPDMRETFDRVFGTEECKGAVNFLQAMPVNDAKIVVDIVNPHLDDNPKPNYFPAVETGAEFAFPVLLNGMSDEVQLLASAEAWLKTALTENGLGAKTAAGYGWFSDVTDKHRKASEEERKARRAQPDETLLQQFAAMKDTDFAGILNDYKEDGEEWWPKEHDAVYQRSLLEAAIRRNLPGKKSQKAKRFLARKFKVELP